MLVFVYEVFNPYHLDAALGEIAIICGGFFEGSTAVSDPAADLTMRCDS